MGSAMAFMLSYMILPITMVRSTVPAHNLPNICQAASA